MPLHLKTISEILDRGGTSAPAHVKKAAAAPELSPEAAAKKAEREKLTKLGLLIDVSREEIAVAADGSYIPSLKKKAEEKEKPEVGSDEEISAIRAQNQKIRERNLKIRTENRSRETEIKGRLSRLKKFLDENNPKLSQYF